MKFIEHCNETEKLFGQTFDYVHKWLDEFAFLPDGLGGTRFNAHHRKYRHHLAGAEEVFEKWGREAYEAAIRHIKSDLQTGEGLKENEELPKNEQDYVRKGFF